MIEAAARLQIVKHYIPTGKPRQKSVSVDRQILDFQSQDICVKFSINASEFFSLAMSSWVLTLTFTIGQTQSVDPSSLCKQI